MNESIRVWNLAFRVDFNRIRGSSSRLFRFLYRVDKHVSKTDISMQDFLLLDHISKHFPTDVKTRPAPSCKDRLLTFKQVVHGLKEGPNRLTRSQAKGNCFQYQQIPLSAAFLVCHDCFLGKITVYLHDTRDTDEFFENPALPVRLTRLDRKSVV